MLSLLESIPLEILEMILEYTLVAPHDHPFSPGAYPSNAKPTLSRPKFDHERMEFFDTSLLQVNKSLAHLAAKTLFGKNKWRLDAPFDKGEKEIAKSFWQRYGQYCKDIDMAFWPIRLRNPHESHLCNQDPPCEWWHVADYEAETGNCFPDLELGYQNWAWQFNILHEDILPHSTLHKLELDLRDLHWYGKWPHWWGQWPKRQKCGEDVGDLLWHRRCHVLQNFAHLLLGNDRLRFESLHYAAWEDMNYIYDRHIDPEYQDVYYQNPASIWNRERLETLVWENDCIMGRKEVTRSQGFVKDLKLRGLLDVEEVEPFYKKAQENGGRLIHKEHSQLGSLVLALKELLYG